MKLPDQLKKLTFGLQFKLMLVVCAGLIIGFTPLGIFSLISAKNEIEHDIIKVGNERIEMSSIALTNLLISYDYSNIEILANKIIQLDNVKQIFIANKSGKMFIEKQSPDFQNLSDRNLKHFEKIIYSDNQPIGKIEIWISIVDHLKILQTQYERIVILLSIFALLFGILIYYTISISILRPFAQFRDSMLKIINNPSVDKRVHLNINSNDEIGELSKIFNEMYGKVFDFQKILKEQNVETAIELQAANEMLIQNSKMASLGEMAGNIAHEINNPLAIITGKSDKVIRLLNQTEIDKPLLIEEVSKIKTTVTRIVKIIKGLKNFSRKDDQDPFQKNKIKSIFDESADLFQDKLSKYEVSFTLNNKLSPETEIECRESQIVQVLVNLVSNAVDAVQELPNKWVILEAQQTSSDWIEITVTDSGNGIPDEIAFKIMDPFFTTKGKNKGTGLGLSISHSIAVEHGGSLTIDKECANTRFVLKLPFLHPKVTASESENT